MKTIRRPDDVLRMYLLVMVIVLVVGAWVAEIFLLYDIKKIPLKGLWYALKAMPEAPILWVGPILGLIVGIFLFAYCFMWFKTDFGGADFVKRLRGARMVSQKMLASSTKKSGKQLTFGGVPIPKDVESTHFFVGGATGSGKSVCISEYMESALLRGDRVICVDPDGGFMRYFYKEGDKILNPFDERGEGWSIFNEIRSMYDCEQYALSMIPRSPSTEQETWNSMARTVVTAVLHILVQRNEGNSENLLYWLTKASNEELFELLKNTPAAGCFHGADATMGSIRTVLTNYITPHKFLERGDFSFRDWLDSGTGNLWITWREDMLQALKPLISCWVDVVCASILSLEEDRDRALHLVVDELDSLEKLNYMVDAATKGRKKGLRIVPGIQSLAQLDNTYGKNDALTLRGCFRTSYLCGIGELDTYTAGEFSKALGEHTVVRYEVSSSDGSKGSSKNRNSRTFTEPLVTASEIHLLPNLTGYLKLAGDYPVSKIKLQYKQREKVVESMILNSKLDNVSFQKSQLWVGKS